MKILASGILILEDKTRRILGTGGGFVLRLGDKPLNPKSRSPKSGIGKQHETKESRGQRQRTEIGSQRSTVRGQRASGS